MRTPLSWLQMALGWPSDARSGRPSSSRVLSWIVSIGLITVCVQAQGQNVYVNPCREFEGPADGTQEHPYPTLTGAVAAAPVGSTVVLQGSQWRQFGQSFPPFTVAYPETGLFTKKLKIETQEGSAVVGQPHGTRRLWQLTGETDLEVNIPTASRTASRYGLAGTDLGSSFEHQGRIYFLFGDTWPSFDPDGENLLPIRPTNSDSIGWIPTNTDPEQPVSINIITAPDGYYLPPILRRSDGQYVCLEENGECQAEYEVPLGGFSANGQMYVFFSTDHTKRPPGPEEDYMGRSVLSRLYDLGSTARMFTYLYDVSCLPDIAPCSFPDGSPKPPVGHFINVAPVVVDNADIPELLQAMGPGRGVLLWGTGLYHESDPYLAYIPLDGVENPASWRYAVTDGDAGHLQGWGNNESDATTPLFVQECGVLGIHCRMGEFSVTWNPFLRKWLMLYNHGNPATSGFAINYRVADKPWGKWEGPYVLYDPACDRGFCHFMHVEGCDAVGDGIIPGLATRRGIVYAPYVISPFTKRDATTTSIYWTMSTWNPYQVMLMKSVLRLSDARRVDHPLPPQ